MYRIPHLYSPYMFDIKGILSLVYLDDHPLHNWKILPIPLHTLSGQRSPIIEIARSAQAKVYAGKSVLSKEPAFYSGSFTINTTEDVKDTFLSVEGWGKGITFINNFNLGRYWPVFGPQCNLYVPAPLIRQGENTVELFELETSNPELTIRFVQEENSVCGRISSSVRDL